MNKWDFHSATHLPPSLPPNPIQCNGDHKSLFLFKGFQTVYNQYADNIQLYVSLNESIDTTISILGKCLDAMVKGIKEIKIKLEPSIKGVMVVGKVIIVLPTLDRLNRLLLTVKSLGMFNSCSGQAVSQ